MRLTSTQIEQLRTIVSMAAAQLAGLSWRDVEDASLAPRSETDSVWRELDREDFIDLLGVLT